METIEKLQETIGKLDSEMPKDQVLKEYSEAWNEFKKMVQDGIASPRGNQQEDITERYRRRFRYKSQ